MKINTKILRPSILLITAILLLLIPNIRLPYLDNKTDSYFSDSITKAALAYGTCRLINGLVSVIKESQIQLEPAGIGVSIAAGQILDPLDDMTERASDILITAIISLGIQKIAYELSIAFAPFLIGITLIAFVISSFFKSSKSKNLYNLFLKLIIILAVARFCLPFSAIINSSINQHYFFPKIDLVKQQLSLNTPEIERLNDMTMPEVDGPWGTIKNGFAFVAQKTKDLGVALSSIKKNLGTMIENLLLLSYLYVAQFIVQVILLPISIFWLLSRLINSLFGTNIPPILKHQEILNTAANPQPEPQKNNS